MLTALTNDRVTRLALPDYGSQVELETVRERARRGELICPTCNQLLVLRAGRIRIPHFAHRTLNDCPHANVSESVLAARCMIYRFFQERIQSRQIHGSVELEPSFDGMPPRAQLDIILKQPEFPTVAVVLLESSLKIEFRSRLGHLLDEHGFLFRPVFLASQLNQTAARTYLLNTTQRDFRQNSPYGVRGDRESAPTLRFVDPSCQHWLSLRTIRPFEKPQAYHADSRFSRMHHLLWCQDHSEWIHPGERETLVVHQEYLKELQKSRRSFLMVNADATPRSSMNSEPEAATKWQEGLNCIGCSIRTNSWQNAQPGKDICVCSACFQRGVRLP